MGTSQSQDVIEHFIKSFPMKMFGISRFVIFFLGKSNIAFRKYSNRYTR